MTGESFARLLGIEGWKIKGEPFCVEASGRSFAMVEIVREKRVYQCGCGRRFTTYYDGEEREVRDLSWGKWDFSLLFFQVRIECPECGVKTEQLDWLVPGSRYTKRFAAYVAQLCRIATVSAVAKHLGLDWKTVKRFEKSALAEELDPPDLEELRVLAVDEITIKKRHKYATVIIDFETRRVVWAVVDRTEEALGSFYEMLGKDRCGLIKAVAMDMWKPYENATRKHFRIGRGGDLSRRLGGGVAGLFRLAPLACIPRQHPLELTHNKRHRRWRRNWDCRDTLTHNGGHRKRGGPPSESSHEKRVSEGDPPPLSTSRQKGKGLDPG